MRAGASAPQSQVLVLHAACHGRRTQADGAATDDSRAGKLKLFYEGPISMADPTTTPPPAPQPPPSRTDQSGSDPDDRGYEVSARPWMVHGAIIIAFAMFVSILGLLYIRWDEAKE